MCTYPDFIKKELTGRFENFYADEWREEFSEIELASPFGLKIVRKVENRGHPPLEVEEVEEVEEENMKEGEDVEMKSEEPEGVNGEGSTPTEPKEGEAPALVPKEEEKKSEPEVPLNPKEKALSLLGLSHESLSGTLEFSEMDSLDLERLEKLKSAASLSLQLSESVAEYISNVPLRIKV